MDETTAAVPWGAATPAAQTARRHLDRTQRRRRRRGRVRDAVAAQRRRRIARALRRRARRDLRRCAGLRGRVVAGPYGDDVAAAHMPRARLGVDVADEGDGARFHVDLDVDGSRVVARLEARRRPDGAEVDEIRVYDVAFSSPNDGALDAVLADTGGVRRSSG